METSKTLIEATVMSKLDPEQNPCAQTLDGASVFSTSTKLVSASGVSYEEGDVVADNNVINKEINNIEVENQVFDAGEFPNSVPGQMLVGGAGGMGDEDNYWNISLTETDMLVNEVFPDDNRMNECIAEPDSGGNIAAALYSDKMANGYELVQEVCATDRGIVDVDAENVVIHEAVEEVAEKVVMHEAIEEVEALKVVMHETIEEEDALQQSVVDSGNKIEVSTAGISLYVDVFGPVDSPVQGDDSCLVEHGNDVEGKAIACHGYRFNVGDLAWVKTNTQLWWPGVICELSDVSNDAAKAEQDRFQVRLFGSGNMLWGRTSQLKSFREYFEQMSRQSNSKSFHCAVEKAVVEIGRRAKLEMTCPCYLEESRSSGVAEGRGTMSKEKGCKLGELPVLHFEPKNLLARVKCFARDVAVPGTIECKVIQNRLSAFYRSIGHHRLPIHQLKPTTDGKCADQNGLTSRVISSKQESKSRNRSSNKDLEDGSGEAACTVITSVMKMPGPISSTKSTDKKVNTIQHVDRGTGGKVEKSYESRERRKSKYLSFPYVDLSRVTKNLTNMEESEMTDPIDDTSMGSARKVKSRDKKSGKSWCKKRHDTSAPDKINASTAEMLSKLRFTALDCLHPFESKHFDIVQSFFSRFRRFAFRDFTLEVKSDDTVWKKLDYELGRPRTLSEVEIHTEKQMKKEVSRECRSTKAATAAHDISKIAGIGLTEEETNFNSMPESSKEEKTTPLCLNTKPTDGFPGNITSGSIVIDFQTIDPHSSKSQTVPMKKKKKANKAPGFPEIKVVVGLADLKGRSIGAQLEGISAGSAGTPDTGKSEPKRKKKATSVKDSMTNCADLPCENRSIGKVVAGLQEVEVMGLYPLQNIPGPNKEVMKEFASLHLNAELDPKAPDVSKNTEPSSVTKGIQKMDMVTHSGRPEVKRKRKQKASNVTSAIPDLNGNTTESSLQETQLPEMKCIKPQKKRKEKTDAGLLDINLSYSEAHTNGEVLGTALLLKFGPEAPIPTKEDLISTFCIFGPLKESETKVLNDFGTAQVVFVNSSDARTAFRSLEKNSPFGPALVNYRLHVLFAASGLPELDGGLNIHQVWPADKVKCPPKPRTTKKPKNPGKPSSISTPKGEGKEAPDLQFIRQNLQMMTSMLENAGDNISPEMRAKLELEIKSLLNKVSTMVESSSTS